MYETIQLFGSEHKLAPKAQGVGNICIDTLSVLKWTAFYVYSGKSFREEEFLY